MNCLPHHQIFNNSVEYSPQDNASAMIVSESTYEIISSGEENPPILLSENISNCVGVAILSKEQGQPTIGAILHIHANKSMFTKTDEALEKHVQNTWNIFVNALHEKSGKKRHYEGYILGGWKSITYKNDNGMMVVGLPHEEIETMKSLWNKDRELDRERGLQMIYSIPEFDSKGLQQEDPRLEALSHEIAEKEKIIQDLWGQTEIGKKEYGEHYQRAENSATISNALHECIAHDGHFNLTDLGFVTDVGYYTGHDVVVDIQQECIAIGQYGENNLFERVSDQVHSKWYSMNVLPDILSAGL